MLITTYEDPDDFLQKTRSVLEQDEISNGLLLGVVSGLIKSPTDFYLATVEDEDCLLVAACMTPPLKIILYSHDANDEAAFAALALHLMQEDWLIPGVVGPTFVSENFAKIWAKLSGQSYHVSMRQRVFQLNKVIPPTRVPGRLRVATENDLDLITCWMAAFYREALPEDKRGITRQMAEIRVRAGNVYLWETPDGQVVSMAAKTRPVTKVITIAFVYTPFAYRGIGYASNCVATLSQLLLDEGWQSCSLFTDLSNRTSNRIYRKMGYEPICDFDEYVFEEG